MLGIMDFFFGPNRSSDSAGPSGARAVYQTVDGRLCARVGGVDEKEVEKEEVEKTVDEQTADELEWLRHSVGVLRDAILAHKRALRNERRVLHHDDEDVTLLRYAEEDVTLWSHVSE